MPRYVIDTVTGIRTKVSGTNYVPPCVVKTQARKAAKKETIITETVTDETTHEDSDKDADSSL